MSANDFEKFRSHAPGCITAPAEMYLNDSPTRFVERLCDEMSEISARISDPAPETFLALHTKRETPTLARALKLRFWNWLAPHEFQHREVTEKAETLLATSYHIHKLGLSGVPSETVLPTPILFTQEPRKLPGSHSAEVEGRFGLLNCSGQPLTVSLLERKKRVALASSVLSGAAFGDLCEAANKSSGEEPPVIIVFTPSAGSIEHDIDYYYSSEDTSGQGLFQKLVSIATERSIDSSFLLLSLFVS